MSILYIHAFHDPYTVLTRALHNSYTVLSRSLHDPFTILTQAFHDPYTGLSRSLHSLTQPYTNVYIKYCHCLYIEAALGCPFCIYKPYTIVYTSLTQSFHNPFTILIWAFHDPYTDLSRSLHSLTQPYTNVYI